MADRVYTLYKKMNQTNSELIKKGIHFWLRIVYGCDIMPRTIIGEGTRFPHNGLGVVINEDAIIGLNCVIGKGVVIGGRSGHVVVPKLGDNVEIGANAVVLGPICIGNNVKIGGGAVVVHDIPDNAVVVGNPGKIIKYVRSEDD